MNKAYSRWSWQDGVVDPQKEHIELCYGDAFKSPYETWVPIARIGKPQKHALPVQWLVSPDSPDLVSMIADVRRELDFLIDCGGPIPWSYAVYHCNTGANVYSKVHCSYFPGGQGGKRKSSMVVKEGEKLFILKQEDVSSHKGKRG